MRGPDRLILAKITVIIARIMNDNTLSNSNNDNKNFKMKTN